MRRSFVLAAGAVLLGSPAAYSQNAPQAPSGFNVVITPSIRTAYGSPGVSGAVSGSTARKKQIERRLQAPLGLDSFEHKTITLAEFIEHVRTHHHINIRLDSQTLMTLEGGGSASSRSKAPPSGSCCGPTSPFSAPCPAPVSCGPVPCEASSRQSFKVTDAKQTEEEAKAAKGESETPFGTSAAPVAVLPNQELADHIATTLKSSGLRGRGIVIETRRGHVIVRGTALSEGDKDKATEVIRSVEGVTFVRNQMVIGSTAAAVAPEAVAYAGLAANSAASVMFVTQPAVAETGVEVPLADEDRVLPAALVETSDDDAQCPACPIAGRPAAAQFGPQPASRGWKKDFEQAKAEAAQKGVPVIVHFEARWCAPCQKMSKEVLESPEVLSAVEGRGVGVRIDCDQHPELMQRFKVRAIPATVVVSCEGDECRTIHVGLTSKSDFAKHVTTAVASSGEAAKEHCTAPCVGASACCAAPACCAASAKCCRESGACKSDCCSHEADCCSDECDEEDEVAKSPMDELKETPIAVSSLALEGVTVESALAQLLEALSPQSEGDEMGLGLPVRTTCATDFAYLVVDDGVLITTRLNANMRKETRIYRVPMLPNCPPEKIAKVLTHSVRPWSWRSQVNEMAEQLAAKCTTGNGLATVVGAYTNEVLKSAGVVTPVGATNPVPGAAATPEVNLAEAAAGLGQFAIHGAATVFQGSVSAIEMIHHADPPTGVIESLPGMLVITQSQAAHREIADFLEQLQEASMPAFTPVGITYPSDESVSVSPPQPHPARTPKMAGRGTHRSGPFGVPAVAPGLVPTLQIIEAPGIPQSYFAPPQPIPPAADQASEDALPPTIVR